MIWLAFGVLIAVALVVLLPPLLRKVGKAAAETSDLVVYRDQLREVDGDLERGLISPAEAEAARVEIKRRMLAAAKRESVSAGAPHKRVAIAVAAGLVAFSGALYLSLGRPMLPGRTFDPAAAHAAEEEEAAKAMLVQVDAMVAKLVARLKANPNDARGWRMLGAVYVQLGRAGEGVEALAHAVALEPKDAALRAQYGEALVFAAQGKITPEAAKAFDAALALDGREPRARFYRCVALVQAGKEREALALWVDIIRDGPADAEWMAGLREQARVLALKLKLDPGSVLPAVK